MLKAKGTAKDGMPIMLLGLSGENVTRLVAGEPITFDAADMGLPACHVIIAYGRTEHDIVEELARRGLVKPPPGEV